MKKTLIAFLAGLLTAVFIYLLASFACADFDIRNWDISSRTIVAVSMGFFGTSAFLITKFNI